jgi:hypothetical protein
MKILKVYSHVADHKDAAEAARRLRWMKEQYPCNFQDLIDGNTAADALAKRGSKGHIYELPPYPTVADTLYFGNAYRRVPDVREYLSKAMQLHLVDHIGNKLNCFKWMNLAVASAVDLLASNYIMMSKDPKITPLMNFIFKARRKILLERGPIWKKKDNPYFQKRARRPIETDLCPLCGSKERRAHSLTSCEKTKHLREGNVSKIRTAIKKATGVEIADIPVWWTNDSVANKWDFKAKWGAWGIIPIRVRRWLKENTGVDNEKIGEIIKDIQLIIINSSFDAWTFRGKSLASRVDVQL